MAEVAKTAVTNEVLEHKNDSYVTARPSVLTRIMYNRMIHSTGWLGGSLRRIFGGNGAFGSLGKG